MKLAINSSIVNKQDALYPLSRMDALKMVCESGFRHLDFNLHREFRIPAAREDSPLLTDGWRDWCCEARETVAGYGAAFIQTHCVFPNYFDKSSPIDAECTAWVPRNLEATALLGAPVTVMHPIAPPGMEYDRPGAMAANRDYFRRVGDMAGALGIKIAVENMLSNRMLDGTIFKRCCTASEELLELVEAIDHPAVGVCLDVGHLHYMHEPIGDAIRACGDKVIAFHLHDNDTWNDSHVPPYCGSIDWEEVYRAVRDINYQGGGMLEVRACWKLPREMQRECLSYLNDLCEFMMEQMNGGK